MRKILWLIIIVLIIFVLYRTFRDQPATDDGPEPVAVALTAVDDSQVSGQVTIDEVDGQAQVIIKLTDLATSVVVPRGSYLQRGSCFALGEPIYTLRPIEGGFSETTLTIARAGITDNLPLAITVYSNGTGEDSQLGNSLLACGDIFLK